MNNKGLSEVIVAVILIVVSLVAVGIVWAVISNVLQSGTEDISLGFEGLSGIQLEIVESSVVVDNSSQFVSMNIRRGKGDANLGKIKFIFFDGTNSGSVDVETNLQQLGTDHFTIDYSGLGLSTIIEISIAPILISESGRESLRDITDTYDVPGSAIGVAIPPVPQVCNDTDTDNYNLTSGGVCGLLVDCDDGNNLVYPGTS